MIFLRVSLPERDAIVTVLFLCHDQNSVEMILKKIEHFFGNLKTAVVLLSVYSVAMIIGTFQESWHGADYAKKLVYTSPGFLGLQLCIFLSIYFATTLRFPYQKRLKGFYIIHLGLLIIFGGAFITHYGGLDAQMILEPSRPQNQVKLSKHLLQIRESGEKATLKLPATTSRKKLNLRYKDFLLEEFYPYARDKQFWENGGQGYSAQYELFNENFSEELTLSLNPLSSYESSLQLGPLNVHLLPEEMSSCFASKNNYFLWNKSKRTCILVENQQELTLKSGKKVVALAYEGKKLVFFPEDSPLPYNEKLQPLTKSPLVILDKGYFAQKPHLFLFAKKMAYFAKEQKAWLVREFLLGQTKKLPWMGFQITSLIATHKRYPEQRPAYEKPWMENNQVPESFFQTLKIKTPEGGNIWAKSNSRLRYRSKNKVYEISIENEKINLPYQITLLNFIMDKDPGTNSPASFKSKVHLLDRETALTQEISMNKPLKYKGLTFYQASYFETSKGYGSVLSVNYDPGRPIKYMGSLLLVLGAMIHFWPRKKKKLKG